MTLAQLEIWYKGCTEYYQLLKEQLVEEVKANTVTPAIPVGEPAKAKPVSREYINIVKSIQLLEKWNWGNRPMYTYLIQFENFHGNFTLNCATETEQKQPQVGTAIKHQLSGTKLIKFKFVKI
jgi:hypothetical protein